MQFAGQLFSQCAFATGRIPVDGDNNFAHVANVCLRS